MRAIHLAAVALLATLAFPLQAAVDAAPAPRSSFSQPTISPDGSRIAFVSGGADAVAADSALINGSWRTGPIGSVHAVRRRRGW